MGFLDRLEKRLLGHLAAEIGDVGAAVAFEPVAEFAEVHVLRQRPFVHIDFEQLEPRRRIGQGNVDEGIEPPRPHHGVIEHPRLVGRPDEQQRRGVFLEAFELLQNLRHDALHDRRPAGLSPRHQGFDLVHEYDRLVLRPITVKQLL